MSIAVQCGITCIAPEFADMQTLPRRGLKCCLYAGRFFTFDVLDAHGGEIRAIAFNNEADRFEPIVNVGDIVDISKASLKPKRNNVRADGIFGTRWSLDRSCCFRATGNAECRTHGQAARYQPCTIKEQNSLTLCVMLMFMFLAQSLT